VVTYTNVEFNKRSAVQTQRWRSATQRSIFALL